MQSRNVKMEVVNPNAAGIDVGSRSHFAAIGQGSGDIKEFGVYNEDLKQLTKWFADNEIKTVAMESTGTYWQHLYITLQAAGFQVILCNGKFTKNIKGKKTDVKDAQWIQKLHAIGLLTGSFLPPNNYALIAGIELIFCNNLPMLPAKCKSTYDFLICV